MDILAISDRSCFDVSLFPIEENFFFSLQELCYAWKTVEVKSMELLLHLHYVAFYFYYKSFADGDAPKEEVVIVTEIKKEVFECCCPFATRIIRTY